MILDGHLDDDPAYRINIYFYGLAKGFTAQAEEEFSRLSNIAPIKYGSITISISIRSVFVDDVLAEKWQQRNVDWKDKNGARKEDITINVNGEAILDTKSAVFLLRLTILCRHMRISDTRYLSRTCVVK